MEAHSPAEHLIQREFKLIRFQMEWSTSQFILSVCFNPLIPEGLPHLSVDANEAGVGNLEVAVNEGNSF
jgi:hypothetical protein